MQVRNAALIIIDMQKGMANPAAGTRNNADAEPNIAALPHAIVPTQDVLKGLAEAA